MATLVLSAAGAAAGASLGGTALGLSSAVLGRAVGATVGRVIDQHILGDGSRAVETGRVDRFRLTGASEGAPIVQIYGRNRVSGHAIWASRFQEHKSTGERRRQGRSRRVQRHRLQLYGQRRPRALRGVITRVGRIWADGTEIAPSDLNLRVYTGADDQQPDPKIAAIEGLENAPCVSRPRLRRDRGP